jgi:hypothetical protein
MNIKDGVCGEVAVCNELGDPLPTTHREPPCTHLPCSTWDLATLRTPFSPHVMRVKVTGAPGPSDDPQEKRG